MNNDILNLHSSIVILIGLPSKNLLFIIPQIHYSVDLFFSFI